MSTTVAALAFSGSTTLPSSEGTTTTVYVGRHYEVRNHDQPVKYVFNGETRAARITGSLSPSERVQRLRLQTGWNLVSLAVNAEDLEGQFRRASLEAVPAVKAAYQWDGKSGNYSLIAAGESVPAGTVLWIRATTNAVVGIRGRYSEPVARQIPAGGHYIATRGLEAWPTEQPASVTAWKFDATGQRWRAGFRGDLSALADLPPALAPGEAVYLIAGAPTELAILKPTLSIAYFHQDHLGSSAAITDAAGHLIEETAYYPFGGTRLDQRLQRVETHYGFTQKEPDAESNLHYFGARYFTALPGRFCSVDPRLSEHQFKDSKSALDFFKNPQRLNHYAYAINNPLRFIDPQGEDPANPQRNREPPKPELTYTLEFKGIEKGPREPIKFSVESFSWADLKPGHPKPIGREPPPPDLHITRLTDRLSPLLMRMTTQGIHIEEATLILTKPGDTPTDKPTEYARITLTDLHISSMQTTQESPGGERVRSESLSLSAAKMEIKFFDPPTTTTTSRPRAWWDYDR